MKKITLSKIKNEIRKAHYDSMFRIGLECNVWINLEKNEIWRNADTKNTRYISSKIISIYSDMHNEVPDDNRNMMQNFFINECLDDIANKAYETYVEAKKEYEKKEN